jgi:HJR/Mrr/RecB family endonuclease
VSDVFWESLQAFGFLWPIWASLAALIVIRLAISGLRELRLARAGLNDVDRMSQFEFEECLQDMFFALGYDVELMGPKTDCCIILTRDGVRTAVHAELMEAGNVPSPAIQEVLEAKTKYASDEAMIVTNRQYTPRARDLASLNSVILWNRDQLAYMLEASRLSDLEPDGEEADDAEDAMPRAA